MRTIGQEAFSPVTEAAAVAYKQRFEFGVQVRTFCARTGMTQKELAKQSGVNYATMVNAMRGKLPGYEVVPRVRRFMESVDPSQ